MVSKTALAVAALLQMWGKSFFVGQRTSECSPAPALGRIIFMAAVLLLIRECNMLPKFYRHRSPWIFDIGEVLTTVFVTEVFMQGGWCIYERLTHKLVGVICYHNAWCEFGFMTTTTIVAAFASLCVVVEVVCPAWIKDSLCDVLYIVPVPDGATSLLNVLQDAHSYVMGTIHFIRLTREQRLLAIQAIELQLQEQKLPSTEQDQEEPLAELPENLDEKTQDLEGLQDPLNLREQAAELDENIEEKIQDLKSLQELMNLHADEYHTSPSDLEPEPDSEPFGESKA